MNSKLIKEIATRIEQVKKEEADESELEAYLDAIANVYETDRATVESIARDIIKKSNASTVSVDLVKIKNIAWISALLLTIVSVIWLLYSSTHLFKIHGLDTSKDNHRTIDYVEEALASLNVVKVYVIEHFSATGSMPSSFVQIGVKERDFLANKYIDRLTMASEGTIVLNFSTLIGEQRYLKLKPIVRIASDEIEWDCRSNLDLAILDAIKGCTPDK